MGVGVVVESWLFGGVLDGDLGEILAGIPEGVVPGSTQ